MNIIDFIKSLFGAGTTHPTYQMGVVPNQEDYRDIELTSVQKPLGGYLPPFKAIPSKLDELDVLDQGRQPACVPHAIAQLLMYYIWRKFNVKVNLSPRFAYKLCKSIDGLPDTAGTYPRVGGFVFTKYGCCTNELLANDTLLTTDEYLAVELIQSLYDDARMHTLPGFAMVEQTLESVKDALNQNDVIVGSTSVGNWYDLPLTPRLSTMLWHYTLWCGYELQSDGKTRIYTKNQWGKGWLNWLKNWLKPGYGYFIWEDYVAAKGVADIMAFTDIPREYMTIVKSLPYRFTKKLFIGIVDPAIVELQKMLNQDVETMVSLDGAGSIGKETAYFGPATKQAVVRWQQKHHIDAIGIFGPLSIAEANKRIPKMTLEQALILQESGGNDQAIGDRNLVKKAYGCLQIRQPCVDDVNRKLGTNYHAEDCLGNRTLSLKIFETYISIYEPNSSNEEKSRCWNGGPSWRLKRSATDGYWSSVNRKLNQ